MGMNVDQLGQQLASFAAYMGDHQQAQDTSLHAYADAAVNVEALARAAAVAAEQVAREAADTALTNAIATINALLAPLRNVVYYGADPTGVADSRAAFLAAEAVGTDIIVPKGTFKLASTTNLTGKVVMAQGAVITLNNVNLGITSRFDSDLTQKFSCSGTASVALGAGTVSRPEWWGAITGSSAQNCGPAINLAINAALVTQLAAADYYTTTTVAYPTNGNGKILQGWSYGYSGPPAALVPVTRICVHHATITGVQMSGPGGGGYVSGLQFRNICVHRTVAPTAQASPANGPHGIVIEHTLMARLDVVGSWNHCNGYLLNDNIQPHIWKCRSDRDVAATNPGSDYYQGFYLPNAAGVSATQNNASVFMTDCAIGNGVPALRTVSSTGINLDGLVQDIWLYRCEVSAVHTGIHLRGSKGVANANDTNIKIESCVCDGIGDMGIYVHDLSAAAQVVHTNNYYALGFAGTAHVRIEGCDGSFRSSASQIYGYTSPSTPGFRIASSVGVNISGDMICDSGKPVELYDSSNCVINPIIENTRTSASGRGAIQVNTIVTGCARNTFAPHIHGGSSYISYGVEFVGSGASKSEVNASAISSYTVGQKVRSNSTHITTAGAFGTDMLASGVMV